MQALGLVWDTSGAQPAPAGCAAVLNVTDAALAPLLIRAAGTWPEEMPLYALCADLSEKLYEKMEDSAL